MPVIVLLIPYVIIYIIDIYIYIYNCLASLSRSRYFGMVKEQSISGMTQRSFNRSTMESAGAGKYAMKSVTEGTPAPEYGDESENKSNFMASFTRYKAMLPKVEKDSTRASSSRKVQSSTTLSNNKSRESVKDERKQQIILNKDWLDGSNRRIMERSKKLEVNVNNVLKIYGCSTTTQMAKSFKLFGGTARKMRSTKSLNSTRSKNIYCQTPSLSSIQYIYIYIYRRGANSFN